MYRLFSKALVCVLLILSLLLSACNNAGDISSVAESSFASESVSEPKQDSGVPEVSYSTETPDFTYDENYFTDGQYVGIYNAITLEEFYSQRANDKIYPASLTKMVTAMVAINYGDLGDIYKVGSELDFVKPHSSLFGIRKGMELTLEHLLYGLMLPSGNDAAYTVAVNIARRASGENLNDAEAIEYFCGLMNAYCAEIGANNSHFTTPEGWDDENQYTTVSDLALIAANALKNQTFRAIVGTHEIRLLIHSGETFYLTNSNKLLDPDGKYYNPDVFGVKTGSTDLAGSCLVAAVKIEDKEYLAIATFCSSDTKRYTTVTELIEMAKRYHFATTTESFNNIAQ